MTDKRHILHALLGAFSILVMGVVAGVALDRVVLIPRHAMSSPVGRPLATPMDHEEVLAELVSELDLTDEQAGQVHGIFARHQPTVDRAWETARSALLAAIASATAEIDRILDADQRERMHEWLEVRHGGAAIHGLNRTP